MDRDEKNRPTETVTEEAVTWFLRIQDGFSQSDFREWRRWLAADDGHALAFDSVREFWQATDQVADLPWPDDDELLADSYDGSSVLPMPVQPPQTRQKNRGRGGYWLAAAASIVAACLIGLGQLSGNGPDPAAYVTATAEHRLIELEDGSSITLGAESEVLIDYDKTVRQIDLRKGEAYFKVAKDSNRPFIVAAGNRTVRALGTEFGVNIGVRDIKVSVIEGKVRVEGPPMNVHEATGQSDPGGSVLNLRSGDVLDFNATGSIGIINEVSPMLSTSWLTGRLAYDGASLESVIADVNRYSPTELIIGDEATRQLVFTGTIFSDEIDNWLGGIEDVFPLRLVRLEGHGILLIHSER